MDEVTTERTLICKLCGSVMCLDYCFDILNMGVYTTNHRQTSGRLVQELHVCIVYRINCCVVYDPANIWLETGNPNGDSGLMWPS